MIPPPRFLSTLTLALSLSTGAALLSCNRQGQVATCAQGAGGAVRCQPTGPGVQVSPTQRRRPTILVTHPTGAFLDSLANLRDRKQIPEAHYVFLMHANQGRRMRKLKPILSEYKFRSYEIVVLKGYPRHPGFDALVAQAGRPIPDLQRKRFHISSNPHLPEKWKKIFREVVDRTDAFFIPGGSNIPAAFYGTKQYVEGMSSTPVRSLYEYALLSFLLNGDDPYLARRPGYLVVGYCYGMQAMNVALGGTLWQSIPVELYKQNYVEDVIAAGPENMHRNYHLAVYPTPAELYRGWFHPLKVLVDTPWIKGEPGIYVLSNHQQAVRELGKNLRILAVSEDGKVPEVMQHVRFPNVVAVQGHPERRFAWNRLDTFSPATRRFHQGFFAQVRKALEESRKGRLARTGLRR